LNAIEGKVPILLAVGADVGRFVPAHGSESSRSISGLFSTSPDNGVFLLEAAENSGHPEGGGVHGRVNRRLEVFKIVAKGIEKKDYPNLVEINWAHVGNPSVHGEDFIGTIRERSVMAITEIESLLE